MTETQQQAVANILGQGIKKAEESHDLKLDQVTIPVSREAEDEGYENRKYL